MGIEDENEKPRQPYADHVIETRVHEHERAVADAAAGVSAPGSVYDVRKRAARIREEHRGEPGFDGDALRAEVRAELDRDGLTVDEGTLDDAVRGMM